MAKVIHRDSYRSYFRFAGQIVAKALFDKIPINVRLNKVLLAYITRGLNSKNLKLEDLKEYDE
jgi:hypothetical protein